MIPWKLKYLFKCLYERRDLRSVVKFVGRNDLNLPRIERIRFVWQIYRITYRVWCAHTQDEILRVATATLKYPPTTAGVIVEAGCYKGGSTAKLSLLAKLANRRLVVYDSFEGLPENDESGQFAMDGGIADFSRGVYRGTREEVEGNIRLFGDLGSCTLVPGWFDETMPHHKEPIIAGFVDVDLVSSTKTCIKFLFPHLVDGGVLFSQDGHLPKVAELLDDSSFWRKELGIEKPPMPGLHSEKLVPILNSLHERGR